MNHSTIVSDKHVFHNTVRANMSEKTVMTQYT